MSEPLILVSNDDGIDSNGIYVLAKEMMKLGEVFVVAPDRQQSAVGHALTVSKPLRITKYQRNDINNEFAINGTPADCVKLAISRILPRKPDLVVSGINHGQNTSVNMLYSGTVSAATEGMLLGIPSMAISLSSYDINSDMSASGIYSYRIAKELLENNLPSGTFINVNIPNLEEQKIKGIKITKQSNSSWDDAYEKRVDPFGKEYFWFSGIYKTNDQNPESDDNAVSEGYVSITPVHYILTNFAAIQNLKHIFG